MRVLFIVTAFPRHDKDVITPWLWTLTKQLQKMGVEVEVLASSYRGMGDQEMWGMKVHRWRYAPARFETLSHDVAIPEKIKKSFLAKLMIPLFILGGIIKAFTIRKRRYDLIHVHWPFPFALLSLPINAPKVLTFYTAEISLAEKLPFLKPLMKRLVATACGISFLTSYGRKRLENLIEIPDDVHVRIIPFMPADFPEVNETQVKRKKHKVLFVGRLVERKGVSYLIDAVKILSSRYPDISLVLVGSGPEMQNLREQASRIGLSEKVIFAGAVSDQEKARQYASAHVFVLPAIVDSTGDTEGQGVVLLEAMFMRVPVVASAVGGITDVVIDGKTGLLVPQKDPAALANAIKRLFEDPSLERELVRNALERLERDFSQQAVAQKVLSFYRQSLDKASSDRA